MGSAQVWLDNVTMSRTSFIAQKDEDRGSTGITSSGRRNFKSFEICTFNRYYFLNKENNYNIIADLFYNYGF